MSNLADFPYTFDNTPIDFPLTWQETVKTVEAVNQTEAGTDVIILTRADKLSVSATARVTSDKLAFYDEYSKKKSFTLYRYDAGTGLYNPRTVRMRNYTRSLKRGSETLEITHGVWDISYTLEEI
jgi:hypothetical protein